MTAFDYGVLLLRGTLGLTMAAHGYAKFYRGGRIAGTAGWFDGMGMRPGRLHALLAASTEVVAGVLLAVGLLTSFAAAGFVSLMFVAAWTVHRGSGFFVVGNGWEYNLVLALSASAVAVMGPGRSSLDEVVFGHALWNGWIGASISVVGGLAAAVGLLVLFYRPPVDAKATSS